MKFPNLRYGNPVEFQAYALGVPLPILAKRLRRSERAVRDWLSGRERVPFWVPELIRLQNLEAQQRARQMNLRPIAPLFGVVAPDATVLPFKRRHGPENPSVPATAHPQVVSEYTDQYRDHG